MIFHDQLNFNPEIEGISKNHTKEKTGSSEEVFKRTTLISTCLQSVNSNLGLEIPIHYYKESIDSEAKGRIVNCAKLDENSAKWYKTGPATLINGSYACNASSFSYFSIIFTPKILLNDIIRGPPIMADPIKPVPRPSSTQDLEENVNPSSSACSNGATKVNGICQPIAKEPFFVSVKSRVTTITWSPKLSDISSVEFRNAETTYCDGWKLTEPTDYLGCQVQSFSKKSRSTRKKRSTDPVVVNAIVILSKSTAPTKATLNSPIGHVLSTIKAEKQSVFEANGFVLGYYQH